MAKRYPGLWVGIKWALCPSVSGGSQASDNRIVDLTGNGHDAVFFGNTAETVSEGRNALDLPGTSDCLDIQDTQSWTGGPGGVCTLSTWTLSDSATGDKYLLGRNRSGNNNGDIAIFLGSSPAPDAMGFFIQDGVSTGGAIYDTSAPSTTAWEHWVATVDGSDIYLYRNGAQVATTATSVVMEAHDNDDFAWGWSSSAHSDTHGPEWDGRVDDCCAWNRVLDPGEIRLLYQIGRGGIHQVTKAKTRVVIDADIFTGTAVATAGAATASASGTFVPPYTGTAAATAGAATASASGTFTAPTYTGTSAATTGGATASGSGDFIPSFSTGTSAATIGMPFVHTTFGLFSGGNVFLGTSFGIIGAATASAQGEYVRWAAHPFKRRTGQSRQFRRRRLNGLDCQLRRKPDHCADRRRATGVYIPYAPAPPEEPTPPTPEVPSAAVGSPHWISTTMIAVFTVETGAVGDNVSSELLVPYEGTIVRAQAYSKTAPGSDLILDITLNGTSIWNATPANRLTIASGANEATAVSSFDTTAVSQDDNLRLNIASGDGGGITVQLVMTPAYRYWGEQDTDGSFRIGQSSDELLVQERISGTWTDLYAFFD